MTSHRGNGDVTGSCGQDTPVCTCCGHVRLYNRKGEDRRDGADSGGQDCRDGTVRIVVTVQTVEVRIVVTVQTVEVRIVVTVQTVRIVVTVQSGSS